MGGGHRGVGGGHRGWVDGMLAGWGAGDSTYLRSTGDREGTLF